jgi:hypothetical protein
MDEVQWTVDKSQLGVTAHDVGLHQNPCIANVEAVGVLSESEHGKEPHRRHRHKDPGFRNIAGSLALCQLGMGCGPTMEMSRIKRKEIGGPTDGGRIFFRADGLHRPFSPEDPHMHIALNKTFLLLFKSVGCSRC